MKLRDLPANVRAAVREQANGRHRPKLTEAEKRLNREKARARREEFFAQLRYARIPLPEFEYRFHPTRAFRWDYAWDSQRLAIEVDGGIYTGGKHGRGAGIEKDHEKANWGATLGWRVIRTTPRKLTALPTVALIKLALEWEP
jgi:very-short-patch-repair endonuclease